MKMRNLIKWTAPSLLVVLAGSVVATPADIDVDGTRNDDPYDNPTAPIVRQASKAIDELLAGPVNASAQSDMTVAMGGEGVGEFSGGPLNGPTADVITGYEGRLNLAALGWDGGDIDITAFVAGGNFLSNQVTGGVEPAQSGNIGNAPAFDFTAMTGSQFVTAPSTATSTTAPTIDGIADDAPYALLFDGGTTGGWSQDTFTQFGDNNNPDREANSGGSEIDAVYGYIYDPDGVANNGDEELVFTITGNLENGGNRLLAFFNVDSSNGVATGFTGGIDLGDYASGTLEFGADAFFAYNRSGDANGHFTGLTTLDNTGAAVIAQGSFVSPLPENMVITDGAMVPTTLLTSDYDNSNVLGVAGSVDGGSLGGTDLANESDPALDTTGIEMRINLTELVSNIGEVMMPAFDPTAMGQGHDGMGGGVRVSGFIIEANAVSNQVVGGLPLGSGALDAVGGLDFSLIAGDQFATISDTTMAAVAIDGTKDASYGATEYVNPGNATTRTSAQGVTGMDDDPLGSELNNLSGVLRNEAGDWVLYLHAGATLSDFDRLYLYLDHTDGAGENQLSGFNPNIDDNRSNNAAGLTFDAGFDADALFVYRLGTDDMTSEVRHFFDGVEITTDAEDLELGGGFGGGAKATTIAGVIEARRGFGNNTLDIDPMDPSALPQTDSTGDELAGMFAYLEERTVNSVTDTYMTIMLTGNLKPTFNKIDIFLDVDDSFGQNTMIWDGDIMTGEGAPIDADYVGNPSVDFDALQAFGGPFPNLATEEDPNDTVQGLTFDNTITRGAPATATFLPDHFITVTLGDLSAGADMIEGTADDDGNIFSNFARLRSPGMDGLFDDDNMGDDDPGIGVFLGQTTIQGVSKALVGGQAGGNGTRWEIAINNENTGGVPGGSSPFGINMTQSNQIGNIETGIEISFPVGTLQVGTDTMTPAPWDGRTPIGVMAMLGNNSHTFYSSQVLPPVCSDELGDPRFIDFNSFDGQQHVFMQAPAMGEGNFVALGGQDFLTFDECAAPTGACVTTAGCIDNVLESTCGNLNGNWLGADTTCAGIVAACCLPGDTCLDLTEADCMMGAGTWQGIDMMTLEPVTCADNPCVPAGTLCSADFDGDFDVDLTDFGTFGAAFGSMMGDANYNADADFDSDGDVDLTDFGTFGAQFGNTAVDCMP